MTHLAEVRGLVGHPHCWVSMVVDQLLVAMGALAARYPSKFLFHLKMLRVCGYASTLQVFKLESPWTGETNRLNVQ